MRQEEMCLFLFPSSHGRTFLLAAQCMLHTTLSFFFSFAFVFCVAHYEKKETVYTPGDACTRPNLKVSHTCRAYPRDYPYLGVLHNGLHIIFLVSVILPVTTGCVVSCYWLSSSH